MIETTMVKTLDINWILVIQHQYSFRIYTRYLFASKENTVPHTGAEPVLDLNCMIWYHTLRNQNGLSPCGTSVKLWISRIRIHAPFIWQIKWTNINNATLLSYYSHHSFYDYLFCISFKYYTFNNFTGAVIQFKIHWTEKFGMNECNEQIHNHRGECMS